MLTLSYPLEYALMWAGLVILVAGLLAWVNLRRAAPLSRGGVRIIGVVWTVVCTVEYWALGPLSALGRPDEYNATIPWLYYLTRLPHGARYSHAFAGGVDMYALLPGTQIVSLERWLYAVLPLWVALAIFRAGAFGLAFAGGYRLTRHAWGASRGQSVLGGLLASGTHIYNYAWVAGGMGWSIALAPWVFDELCVRVDRPRYVLRAAVLAAIYAATASVFHTLPGLFVAVLLAAWLVGVRRWVRLCAALALFAAIATINSLGGLAAVFQLAPELSRASDVTTPIAIFRYLTLNQDVLVVPIAAVALAALALARDRWWIRGAVALAAVLGIGPISAWLVPRVTAMRALTGYRWELLGDAYVLIVVLSAGRALTSLRWTSARATVGRLVAPPAGALYVGAVVVVALAHHKAINVINLQAYGGDAFFGRASCLADARWRAPQPFRVASLYSLFAGNTAAAYGLDTFDGAITGYSMRRTEFFGRAVEVPPDPHPNSKNQFLFLPAASATAADAINLDALRIANVRYLLSDRPLDDPTLRLASSVCTGPPLLGVSPAIAAWLTGWAPRATIGPQYIYELSGAWPRVFVPAAVRVSPSTPEDQAYYDELVRDASEPVALFASSDAGNLGPAMPSADAFTLERAALVPDGFEIDVDRRSPGGGNGLVVINAPYSRFWRATAEGRSLEIVPVNGVQFAVVLEGAIRHVTLRYARPTLQESLLSVLTS